MTEEKIIKVKANFHNHTEFLDVIEIVDKNNYLIVNNKSYDGFQVAKSICEILSTEETLSDLEYKHLAGIWAMGQMAALNNNYALGACIEVVMQEYYKQHPEIIEESITDRKAEVIPSKDSNKEDLQSALNHAYETITDLKTENNILKDAAASVHWPAPEEVNVAASLVLKNPSGLAEYYAFKRGVDWVKTKISV